MIAETLAPPTISDLLRRYGPIDPTRFRLDRYPATEEDVVELEVREDRLFELVDGVLLEKDMAFSESQIAGYILTMLNIHVLPRKLGVVTGESGMIRLFPGLVRIPDVAFTGWHQFPNRKLSLRVKVAPVHPDLAVEVLSAGNTEEEMEEKLDEYFRSGTSLVWYVDPKKRSVRVYTSVEVFTTVPASGVLEGGTVLPDFTLAVADIFAEFD